MENKEWKGVREMKIKETIIEFENMEHGVINVVDQYLGIRFKINRKDIKKITYAASDKDEVYVDFIANKSIITCYGLFAKGSLVTNWTLDERCRLNIIQ